jgi:hypothetical protein
MAIILAFHPIDLTYCLYRWQHGVIGAVSAVIALSSNSVGNPAQLSQATDSFDSCSQRQRATHSRAGQAISLLDTLKVCAFAPR